MQKGNYSCQWNGQMELEISVFCHLGCHLWSVSDISNFDLTQNTAIDIMNSDMYD